MLAVFWVLFVYKTCLREWRPVNHDLPVLFQKSFNNNFNNNFIIKSTKDLRIPPPATLCTARLSPWSGQMFGRLKVGTMSLWSPGLSVHWLVSPSPTLESLCHCHCHFAAILPARIRSSFCHHFLQEVFPDAPRPTQELCQAPCSSLGCAIQPPGYAHVESSPDR